MIPTNNTKQFNFNKPTNNTPAPAENKQRPVKTFRAGTIKAAIWERHTQEENRTFHSVTIEKSYKNSAGQWANTNSLDANDLPKANLVLTKAYEWLTLQESNEENDGAA